MSKYLLATLVWFTLAAATPAALARGPGPLDFAVIGDPQLGYGKGGAWGGSERFTSLLAHLNAAGVRTLIIPGDLVQDRSWFEYWAFERALRTSRAEVLLAPGNHDVVDVASLAEHRRRYGPDYYVRRAGGATFVVVNSETARTPLLSEHEFRQQWAFLDRALSEAGGTGTPPASPVFLVTHRPPFVDSEDEEASEANWPLETRARLLTLCRRAGVETILAGHLHRTHRAKSADGIEVRVLCGSARCFDDSPIGYADYGSGGPRLVNVAPPPPQPWSVPYLREWTPRLFDFSLRHWFFTVLFAGASLLAARAAKAQNSEPARRAVRARPSPFSAVSLAMLFFALNAQLDFDEAIREAGRVLAHVTGIYPVRHALSPVLVAVGAVVVGVWFARHLQRGITALEKVAVAGCIAPSAWFALSAISHHDLGMLWDELIWDGLTLLSLAAVSWAALRASRQRTRSEARLQ